VSDIQTTTLDERLQNLVAEAGPPRRGKPVRDPVNRPMIHHWCDAIGDTNPVYLDEEVAAASLHGGIVAPPTMLQAWSMPGLAPKRRDTGDTPIANPTRLLHEAGYTSVVATDCEQDYARYLKPGDVLSIASELESISNEKHTALGDGYFVTTKSTYYDQNDEVVAEMRFRILWFKPPQREGA
jgi:acyl dehydratase